MQRLTQEAGNRSPFEIMLMPELIQFRALGFSRGILQVVEWSTDTVVRKNLNSLDLKFMLTNPKGNKSKLTKLLPTRDSTVG